MSSRRADHPAYAGSASISPATSTIAPETSVTTAVPMSSTKARLSNPVPPPTSSTRIAGDNGTVSRIAAAIMSARSRA